MNLDSTEVKPVSPHREMILRLGLAALQTTKHRPWLPSDPNQAFVCCIGAGPWKYGRRRTIQLKALTQLGQRCISQLSGDEQWFPLGWQNRMLSSLTVTLKTLQTSMFHFGAALQGMEPVKARTTFYDACGSPEGTKVLSLFLRDFVGVPCFPIDRHVRRELLLLCLPTKEVDLLAAFTDVGVDPIPAARMLGTSKLDGGNPDWSDWPNKPAPEKVL